MPQAFERLREQFNHDGEAWAVLRNKFTETAGLIRPKKAGYIPSLREADAIDYLVLEWDYAYTTEAA